MDVAHAGGREASLFYGKISGSSPNMERILRRIMKQHGVSREDVLIGYEAGPCGFVLAKRGSANVTAEARYPVASRRLLEGLILLDP